MLDAITRRFLIELLPHAKRRTENVRETVPRLAGRMLGMVVWEGQPAARRAGAVRSDLSPHLLCLSLCLCSLHSRDREAQLTRGYMWLWCTCGYTQITPNHVHVGFIRPCRSLDTTQHTRRGSTVRYSVGSRDCKWCLCVLRYPHQQP